MQSDLLLRKVLEEIFLNSHLKVLRIPDSHAGGKWRLKYSSVLGGQGSLEVDLNFLQRVPLWQTQKSNSVSVGGKWVQSVRVMNVCELFAGKMAALFSRSAARDFFSVIDYVRIVLDRVQRAAAGEGELAHARAEGRRMEDRAHRLVSGIHQGEVVAEGVPRGHELGSTHLFEPDLR